MRIDFLIMPAWAWELPEIYGDILTHAAEHRRRHPRHRFSFLCNTPAQEPPFAAAGWPVTTMNANMFIDESTFRPLPKAEPAFTAIYNARLSKDKRIDLAAGIERACFIYFYSDELTVSEFHAEHARLSALMPTATFLNRLTPKGCEYLWGKDINAALNRSRVGLCLSPVEGQMRASMEYMLAGLPIVSTPSIGGRDYFFDPDYCLVTPADPRSIAEAVAALIARNIPRDYIRQKTWARVERERARFTAFMQNRIGRRGGGQDFAARFEWLIRSWQIKPWLTDVRGFAEQLDSAVLEAKRRR
jgi:glycosyltransferase involved in cell wall biosynthesis